MAQPDNKTGIGKLAVALAATAGLAFAVPSAVFALVGSDSASDVGSSFDFAPFTPTTVDPALAKRVAENIRANGLDLRFTPANTSTTRDQTVTVAIRVNEQTARSISGRSAVSLAQVPSGINSVTLAPTRYNLGVARGYQSFAKAPTAPVKLRTVEMPDLAEFKPSEGSASNKSSRFKTRIALEQDDNVGRSPRTLESIGDQSFDLGGAYRVTKNLDVTAGVRLSQDRDRIDPLTDNVQDSQAVYVGTQFRF